MSPIDANRLMFFDIIPDLCRRFGPELNKMGIVAGWTESEATLLKQVENNRSDAIVVVHRPSSLCAIEVVHKVRSKDVGIPIIVIGEECDGIEDEVLMAGASDFLDMGTATSEMLYRSIRFKIAGYRQWQQSLTPESQQVSMCHGVGASIVGLMESFSPALARHAHDTEDLVVAIGLELGFSARSLDALRFASRVHDIGMMMVPMGILSKTGPLDKTEQRVIRNHVHVGHDFVAGLETSWPVAEMVLHHHERFDGSGYPYGLQGSAVSLETRVLAVADVVAAMSVPSHSRQAFTVGETLSWVISRRGKDFDPNVVEALAMVVSRFRGNMSDNSLLAGTQWRENSWQNTLN